MKDHYNNMILIRHVFAKEFCPYIDIVRANRRAFAKMAHDIRKDTIMDQFNEIVDKASDEVVEVLATSILPRFAKQLPTQY